MTYQDDPNINRRRTTARDETSYTGWIIGGIVALLVIAGIFMISGRHDTTNSAANNGTPATTTSQAPAPATTGSGTADVPTPPAKPAPANR